jgi:two-component system cell cycle sensor histidine kinase/response regulator CckA
LTGAGYADGKDALDSFAAQAGRFDVLVTDVAMSPMAGTDLASELVQRNPDLKVVFISGFAGAAAFRYRGDPISSFAFLQKPLRSETLLTHLRELLQPGQREVPQGSSTSA